MDTEAKVNVIKELIDIRDQTSDCNMLSMEEVSEMIDYLCTSSSNICVFFFLFFHSVLLLLPFPIFSPPLSL